MPFKFIRKLLPTNQGRRAGLVRLWRGRTRVRARTQRRFINIYSSMEDGGPSARGSSKDSTVSCSSSRTLGIAATQHDRVAVPRRGSSRGDRGLAHTPRVYARMKRQATHTRCISRDRVSLHSYAYRAPRPGRGANPLARGPALYARCLCRTTGTIASSSPTRTTRLAFLSASTTQLCPSIPGNRSAASGILRLRFVPLRRACHTLLVAPLRSRRCNSLDTRRFWLYDSWFDSFAAPDTAHTHAYTRYTTARYDRGKIVRGTMNHRHMERGSSIG